MGGGGRSCKLHFPFNPESQTLYKPILFNSSSWQSQSLHSASFFSLVIKMIFSLSKDIKLYIPWSYKYCYMLLSILGQVNILTLYIMHPLHFVTILTAQHFIRPSGQLISLWHASQIYHRSSCDLRLQSCPKLLQNLHQSNLLSAQFSYAAHQ